MDDRFLRGFIAGIISDIVVNIWSFSAKAIGITNLNTADLIGVLIYAKAPPFTSYEIIYALFAHLIACGIIGISFAYFISRLTMRHILFKGWIFSIAVWYFIYISTTFFQVPGTIPTPLKQVITSSISASIFGLLLAYSYLRLSKRFSRN